MSDSTEEPLRHVVVVNQHGDNRGDEAAMRAMVNGVAARLGPVRFTIVHQFNDAASEVSLDHPVEYLRLRLPVVEYLRLALFAALHRAGLRRPGIAGRQGRKIIRAIATADLVLSAPGGPYFGDLYSDHEIVHWLFVWLAKLEAKPLALYAPSCGPFENRLLNPVRRRGFSWFDEVCLREQRSADHHHALTGHYAVVTTDSALQESVPPADRSLWADPDERLCVVAVRDPGRNRQPRHDEAILAAIRAVAESAPTSIVLLPQLHGASRRDAPYLENLVTAMAPDPPDRCRMRVAPETLDSNEQRALVAAADFVIAGRYHPAVFSIAAGTPVLVVAYEHKAIGVAEAAGIAKWVTQLDDIDPQRLADDARRLVEHRHDVEELLMEASERLRSLSAQTSECVTRLVR